jgi:hypothetical protein
VEIDKIDFGQVQHSAQVLVVYPLAQFSNAIGADPADQAEDYPSPVQFCFNSEH